MRIYTIQFLIKNCFKVNSIPNHVQCTDRQHSKDDKCVEVQDSWTCEIFFVFFFEALDHNPGKSPSISQKATNNGCTCKSGLKGNVAVFQLFDKPGQLSTLML